MTERLGVLGGTFDPVHIGHLAAAVNARHALRLDRVLLVVAHHPWQKSGRPLTPADDRLALVEAAVDGHQGLEASRIEIDRPGDTYTADTLDQLHREDADRHLFLIVGTDVAAELHTWKRPDVVARLATLAVVGRGGVDEPERRPRPRMAGRTGRHAPPRHLQLRAPPAPRRRPSRRLPRPRPGNQPHTPAGSVRWRHDDDGLRRPVTNTGDSAPDQVRDWARVAARAAASKGGEETIILEVGKVLAITESFVITSGRNHRQVATIAEEVEAQLKTEAGIRPLRIEGKAQAEWVLLDFGDFVVHAFLDETRHYYDLERLWSDAPRIEWEDSSARS